MEKSLSGKNILITGGSSRLGQAFIQKALVRGAKIFTTYYEHEEDVTSLSEQGGEAFRLNLSDMRAIDVFAKMMKEKIDGLDVLIHNAACARDKTIQNLSDEDWDQVLTVNLKAPYYLTKQLLPLLLRVRKTPSPLSSPPTGGEGGVRGKPLSKIFMIISRMAISGGYGAANYAAAKAGLIGLTKSLAAELGRKNVLVNAVNPGFMVSRMTESLPQEVIEKNRAASFLDRFSNPDEVADFLAFLCSDQMTQVTGQVLHFESRKI